MVLEWRERTHEDIDRAELGHPLTLNALRRCGLLKFFCTTNMCAQVRLLETLVQLWDPKQDMFDLQGEQLEITTKDIYYQNDKILRKVILFYLCVGYNNITWTSEELDWISLK